MKTTNESFDDIVFENRNKSYGAYELRKKYSKRGALALAISMFILFSAVGGPLIANIMKKNSYRRYIENNTTAEMTKLPKEKTEVAPPPPPPPPAPVKEIKFVAPKVVDSISSDEADILSNSDFGDDFKNAPVDTTTHYEPEVFKPEVEQIVEVPIDIFAVQEKPSYPGGDQALMKFVAEHTKYPVPALEGGIEGTVYIRFVVTKTGEIGQTNVLRGADPLLDEEAIRVVKTLPKWTPGKNNGNPVNVWFIIPVKFVLN